MRRVVRAFWGPRPQSVGDLAERWEATLDRIAALLPHLRPPDSRGPWTWNRIVDDTSTPLTADRESLAGALQEESDSSGLLFLVLVGPSGWKADLHGVGGEVSEYLSNSLVVTLRSPDDAPVPEAELLAGIAELWNPDTGNVIDDDVFDLLEERADYETGDPATGWLTYLSPARAALVPEDLKAVRRQLSTGGVLLDLGAPDDHDAVLAAHLRLREAGALRPLPEPMDRSML
ncbi:hypothetical protein OG897_21535 [Streptomyces sp. NBC_00237]|uniref:hypothetical protein n=1 Tax=Streptomyces sp. NBC_00237 TaxID=2975687 RepID=UPI00225B25CD|nr:hypothetical protein [Streptomyces sp. NBC_00237]MCX5204021.1 hypothetical protein [Streptomyces sp. NBC_00237]